MSRKIKKNITKGNRTTLPIKDNKKMLSVIEYWKIQYLKSTTTSSKNKAYRNYMLCLLGFNTAFRAEDLLQLRVKNLIKGYVSIKESKTGKPQNFALNKKIFMEIQEYVKNLDLTALDYIFFSYRPSDSKPLSRPGANKILNKAGEYAKLHQQFSCHSMRKTFAYHFYESGGNLLTLQKMLNHSSPMTTLIYINWDTTDAENARLNTHFGV